LSALSALASDGASLTLSLRPCDHAPWAAGGGKSAGGGGSCAKDGEGSGLGEATAPACTACASVSPMADSPARCQPGSKGSSCFGLSSLLAGAAVLSDCRPVVQSNLGPCGISGCCCCWLPGDEGAICSLSNEARELAEDACELSDEDDPCVASGCCCCCCWAPR